MPLTMAAPSVAMPARATVNKGMVMCKVVSADGDKDSYLQELIMRGAWL